MADITPEQSDSEVGYFEARMPITIARETEVGIAWEACCEPLGLCAVGQTQREAADNLMTFINKRGVVGRGHVTVKE